MMAPDDRRRSCLPLGGLLLGLAFGFALPAGADPLDLAATSPLAWSERLEMFALGRLLEQGGSTPELTDRLKRRMMAQGFYHDGAAPRLLLSSAWVAPVLGYDDNINGGAVQDRLVVGSIILTPAPDAIAKAGTVVGLGIGGEARVAYGTGRYLEAQVQGEALWSPEHEIDREAAFLSLCARNHLGGPDAAFSFLDLCAATFRQSRDLGEDSVSQGSVGLVQLFALGSGLHEGSVTVTRSVSGPDDPLHQNALTLGLETLWPSSVTRISLTAAPPVTDRHTQRWRIDADRRWIWRDRVLEAGIWADRADGSSFLGAARRDTRFGGHLSIAPTPMITLGVTLARTVSSIDYFDETSVGLTVRLSALRW